LGEWAVGCSATTRATVADAFADVVERASWFEQLVFAVHDRQPGRRLARTREMRRSCSV
jgi:hypothetical protein